MGREAVLPKSAIAKADPPTLESPTAPKENILGIIQQRCGRLGVSVTGWHLLAKPWLRAGNFGAFEI